MRLTAFRTPLSRRAELALGLVGLGFFLGACHLTAISGLVKPQFLPTPAAVVEAFGRLFTERGFAEDVAISIGRVWAAFALSVVIAVPLGLMMSCYRAVGATLRASTRSSTSAFPSSCSPSRRRRRGRPRAARRGRTR